MPKITKNLIQIKKTKYITWTYRLNAGTTYSSRSEPHCSSIKDYFKYENKGEDGTKRVYVSFVNPNHNFIDTQPIFIIKKGSNYYIDTNSNSFNSIREDLRGAIIDYLTK